MNVIELLDEEEEKFKIIEAAQKKAFFKAETEAQNNEMSKINVDDPNERKQSLQYENTRAAGGCFYAKLSERGER